MSYTKVRIVEVPRVGISADGEIDAFVDSRRREEEPYDQCAWCTEPVVDAIAAKHKVSHVRMQDGDAPVDRKYKACQHLATPKS